MKKDLTWRDIFDCKLRYGHYSSCEYAAQRVGYKYYMWNDRVYEVGGSFTDKAPTLKELGLE